MKHLSKEPVDLPITEFQGRYRWLSNFWRVDILFEGCVFPSVEHAYQAAKFTDDDFRAKFVTGKGLTPGEAKRLAKVHEDRIRVSWDQEKVDVMYNLLRKKFAQPYLRKMLIQTGNAELVEGNHWGDTFWGVCRGEGKNMLGRLLMLIREELK